MLSGPQSFLGSLRRQKGAAGACSIAQLALRPLLRFAMWAEQITGTCLRRDMLVQLQQHNQQIIHLLQTVGNAARAGERAQKGILTSTDSPTVKDFSGTGGKHWSFPFHVASKNASIDVYRILTSMETGTHKTWA